MLCLLVYFKTILSTLFPYQKTEGEGSNDPSSVK